MKCVDKAKRKLKFIKWMQKYGDKLLLGITMPLVFLNAILLPIFPVVAISCLLVAGVVAIVGGPIQLKYGIDKDEELLVEKQIVAMETASEEQVEVYKATIEDLKQNPTKVKDKQTTNRLIKELIKLF